MLRVCTRVALCLLFCPSKGAKKGKAYYTNNPVVAKSIKSLSNCITAGSDPEALGYACAMLFEDRLIGNSFGLKMKLRSFLDMPNRLGMYVNIISTGNWLDLISAIARTVQIPISKNPTVLKRDTGKSLAECCVSFEVFFVHCRRVVLPNDIEVIGSSYLA